MTDLEKGSIKIDNWMVVAFITEGVYELELAQHLLTSLDKLRIPYYIETIENKGTWLKNVAEKPAVAYRALENNPSKNIVLLDADSEILQYPKLFNEIPEKYDLACHFLEWESWYGYKENKTKELLTGTMFLRNNDKVKELCKQWYDRANNNHEWEQKSLASVVTNSNIKIYNLPLSYCYIFTLPNGKEPLVKIDNPHIVHYQASRRYRKIIKWKK